MTLVALTLVVGTGCGVKQMTPTYEELVGLRENVTKEWAGVEAHMQRRYDLIPNLVEVAKGAAAHESGVFLAVAGARQRYQAARTPADRIAASHDAELALRALPIFVRQSFPQLQAVERFAALMRTLERTEDGLLTQRLRYNDAVAKFNGRRGSVTGRVVSVFARFEPEPYYEAPSASSAAPQLFAPPSSSVLLEVKAPPVDSGVPDASADATGPTPDAGPPPPKYVLKGVMSAGAQREAILVGPDGASRVVRVGKTLPGTRTKVVAIDDRGVTLVDEGVDPPATRRVE